MTYQHRITLAIMIAVCCFALAVLAVAAWPATGSAGPTVIPTTYGPPGPDGGPG